MSREKIVDDPREAELLRVYAAGNNLAKSASMLGMSRDRASEILAEAGVLRTSKPWPAAKVEQLRQLRESGLSWTEIGIELCVPPERAAKAHRQYVQGLPRGGRVPQGRDDGHKPPKPHKVIGRITEPREDIARKVAAEVRRLGAVVMLHHRGQIVTAIPGTRVALAAEREGAVINRYTNAPAGFGADWVAEDLRDSGVVP